MSEAVDNKKFFRRFNPSYELPNNKYDNPTILHNKHFNPCEPYNVLTQFEPKKAEIKIALHSFDKLSPKYIQVTNSVSLKIDTLKGLYLKNRCITLQIEGNASSPDSLTSNCIMKVSCVC